MKFVVGLSSKTSIKTKDVTIKSLNGIVKPVYTIISDLGNSVQRGMYDNDVIIKRNASDYGPLTGFYGAVKWCKESLSSEEQKDIWILICNDNCVYPQHLMNEYMSCVPEIVRILNEKNKTGLVESNLCFGLSGITLTEDKKTAMDMEIECLRENKPLPTIEKRSRFGYLKDNCNVDILEQFASIIVPLSCIDNDLETYLKIYMSPKLTTSQCSDLVLSNYLARKKIMRVQIYNYAINRHLLLRGGYVGNRQYRIDSVKEPLYVQAIRELKEFNQFFLW